MYLLSESDTTVITLTIKIYFNKLFVPMFTKCEFKSQFPNKFQVTGSFHNQKQLCFSNNPVKHLDKSQLPITK